MCIGDGMGAIEPVCSAAGSMTPALEDLRRMPSLGAPVYSGLGSGCLAISPAGIRVMTGLAEHSRPVQEPANGRLHHPHPR